MQIYVKSANKQVINVSLFCFKSNLRFESMQSLIKRAPCQLSFWLRWLTRVGLVIDYAEVTPAFIDIVWKLHVCIVVDYTDKMSE